MEYSELRPIICKTLSCFPQPIPQGLPFKDLNLSLRLFDVIKIINTIKLHKQLVRSTFLLKKLIMESSFVLRYCKSLSTQLKINI